MILLRLDNFFFGPSAWGPVKVVIRNVLNCSGYFTALFQVLSCTMPSRFCAESVLCRNVLEWERKLERGRLTCWTKKKGVNRTKNFFRSYLFQTFEIV